MQTKHKYDTIVPLLFIEGKEHLLEENFRKSIPKSTIYHWKTTGYENYYGYQYRQTVAEAIDFHSVYLEHERLKKVINCITKTWINVSQIILPILHKRKDLSEFIMNQTQFLMKTLPKKTALQISGFSSQTFRYRINSLHTCMGSPIKSCIKQNSKQLSNSEVGTIKKLFDEKDNGWWSMKSLYFDGLRSGKLSIALSTFYKYAKLLGLSRKSIKLKERKVGIVSTAPNQYLHIDTTYYHHLDSGHKAAIVFASDNYSKFITRHTVVEKNSALNIYTTIKQTIKTIHKFHPRHICLTQLVADGGSENNNKTIDELLKTFQNPPIQKIIAKKDIKFSNSPIEAVNKIYKRFLRYHKPKTFEELEKVTDLFVLTYNTIRPHGSLNGLTPQEVYENKEAINYSERIAKARITRLIENKKMVCGVC